MHGRRKVPDPTDGLARQLVAEVEAVLAGHLAEHLEQHERLVPAWAWLNLLAHGTGAELADAAGRERWHPSAAWFRARSFLAGEVLARADARHQPLEAIQSEVLIPLELRLADRPLTWRPVPAELVRLVLAALDARAGDPGQRPDGPRWGA